MLCEVSRVRADIRFLRLSRFLLNPRHIPMLREPCALGFLKRVVGLRNDPHALPRQSFRDVRYPRCGSF